MLLVALALATIGVFAARTLDEHRADSLAPRAATTSIVDEPAPAEQVQAASLFPTTSVEDGERRPTGLGVPGQPTVLMINSTSCGFCKQSLRDLATLSGGRPLPGLRVLTLEGAREGMPMVTAAGVRGVEFIGPASDAARVLFTFRIQGTPTFVAIDRHGVVRRLMPGYPGRDELRRWLPVMQRTADWPDG